MVKKKRVENMKLIGQEEKTIKDINIILTIDELNDFIKFLNHAKKQFIKRKNDNSIKFIKCEEGKINIETVTNFEKLFDFDKNIVEDHAHYVDWYFSKYHKSLETDIVVHTIFEAKRNSDDSFIWINKKDD